MGRRTLGAMLVVLVQTLPARADEPVIDSAMYRNPELPTPRVVQTFPDGLAELWLKALDRPEADYKSRAALSIAQAHGRGMKGLATMVPALARELERADQQAAVLVAAAQALVALDARDAAESLSRAGAAGDADLREIVEPVLAKWDFKPTRADWLARLEKPPYRRGAILAIQGLATVREEKAIPRLREIVLSREVPPSVRLEAARALGTLRTAGSEQDAERLAGDATPRGLADRLAAASLLRYHKGGSATKQLQALARDTEPAVAAVVLTRLVELDPALVIPILERVLASPDTRVRSLGVEALARQPSDKHIRLLGDRLNDPHPDVRAQSSRALREIAKKPDLREAVIREGVRLLAATDWRGLEQSAMLLGQLDHKAAVSRMVELLKNSRTEVTVAAAWGLRQLSVEETLPAVLEHVRVTAGAPGRPVPPSADDAKLAQLVQFLGQSRYRPADPVLRKFIPPLFGSGLTAGHETRAAAVWALGLIHDGAADPELISLFSGRLAAVNPGDLEDNRVRRMAAISLGRMKAKDSVPLLRKFYPAQKPSLDVVGNACGWAIEQITGETVPAPGTIEVPQRDWFLSPLP
jgi:HEAT repeat protein